MYQKLEKNITDDVDPGFCQINQKRTDSEWVQVSELVVIDTPLEWRKVVTRKCSTNFAFHGGFFGCQGNTEIVEHLLFYHEFSTSANRKNFDDANNHCINDGGMLFSNFDGSQAQLDFLCNRMSNSYFWVGVTDWAQEGMSLFIIALPWSNSKKWPI